MLTDGYFPWLPAIIYITVGGTIYSRIALSFAINHIFFSANENGTVKQNNQSDFKAFLNSPITLQENKGTLTKATS